MARPTAQVLTLLELLQSGGTRTTAELAGRIGVDERTVRRYVDHLLDLDVPVESVRGRYGGYRLGPGYRLPPLMLTDDEAVAVLLGLVAGQRTGLTTAAGTSADPVGGTASETAAAKIRRVLPPRLADRLDAVLATLAFTADPGAADGATPPAAEFPAPDTATLLTMADAVRHRRPVALRYTAAGGRVTRRVVHPYGLVAHEGRWYVTGVDPAVGEDRTLRLDRIADARARPGSFEPPAGLDAARRVLDSLATAPYRHHVILRLQGTVAQVRNRLPASVATVTEEPTGPGAGSGEGGWLRVEVRAEKLDWLPPLLASLDLPFVIEQPGELRERMRDLARRLAESAERLPDPQSP